MIDSLAHVHSNIDQAEKKKFYGNTNLSILQNSQNTSATKSTFQRIYTATPDDSIEEKNDSIQRCFCDSRKRYKEHL